MEEILKRRMYELIYDDDVPNSQFYIDYFKTLPSKRVIKGTFNNEVASFFIDMGFNVIALNDKVSVGDNDKPIVKLPNGISFAISDRNSKMLLKHEDKKMLAILTFTVVKDEYYRGEIDILYDINLGEFSSQLDIAPLKKITKEEAESNIKLIRNDNGYIDTEDFDLTVPKVDLNLNYGSEFLEKHNIILDSLNKLNNKGIVLLHGEAGTGKTTYIKYLTSLIKDKNILFVPPSMADILSEPSIIPFLIENTNSILLIEDGEKVISDREANPNYASGVSNLLNMTDGILGDCLNIQVIVTFNMEREKIDKALLRNGRLISEHKFKALSVDDSKKLVEHLGKEYDVIKPMTLADIYNVDSKTFREKKEGGKIGFSK